MIFHFNPSNINYGSTVTLVLTRSFSRFTRYPYGRFQPIFPLILNQVESLYYAHNIETKRDMYPISEEECKQIIGALRESSFRFLPLYRIYIPKPGKPGKLRPITIPHPRDIIVMEALEKILTEFFETIFMPSSHGFRPKRGTRTCYWDIFSLENVHYCIDADIVSCFDEIPHKRLLDYIRLIIDDENLQALISLFLKADIVDKKGTNYGGKDKGIPQGSPASPILMNIYLHHLDVLVDNYLVRYPYAHYVRYADNILLICKVGNLDPQILVDHLENFVTDLNLRLTISINSRGGPPFMFLGIYLKVYSDGHINIFAPLSRIGRKIDVIRDQNKGLEAPIKDPEALEDKQQSLVNLYSHKIVSYLGFFIKCHNSSKLKELLKKKMLDSCLQDIAKIAKTSVSNVKKKWGSSLQRAPIPFIPRKQIDCAFQKMLRKYDRQGREFRRTGKVTKKLFRRTKTVKKPR